MTTLKHKHSASKPNFFHRNGLSLTLLALLLVSLAGQYITGWKEYNEELEKAGALAVSFWAYASSGHFFQATFENWESEFLQMTLYVLFTIWLRQEGSSESKHPTKKAEVDREPKPHPDAPWPVNKGGWWLKLYQNSLSIALGMLFVISFVFHFCGSLKDYNEMQVLEGQATVDAWTYLGQSRFWFESFQNWQSEFLAVFSIVWLSIWLRQKGSPESKPVDAPYDETPG